MPRPKYCQFFGGSVLANYDDHIYGRRNILANNNRSHMFIKELHLYIDFLKEQLEGDAEPEQFSKKKKYYASFYQHLMEGILYYRRLSGVALQQRDQFVKDLYYADL